MKKFLSFFISLIIIVTGVFSSNRVFATKYESTPKEKFQDNLSFVAIIKNEAPYIKEWIEFHKLVGVDRFYIYDNESTDNVRDVLKEYIDKGEVVYTYFPGQCKQNPAYMDAVNKYKNKTKYMGFIDLDEFVIPVTEKSLVKVIDEILSKNKKSAGVAINWRTYGSSGHKSMPTGLVTENYKNRAEDSWKYHNNIKTICNPRLVSNFHTHYATYEKPYYAVNENGKRIPTWYNFENSCQKLRINHYFTKSFDEFIKKRERGCADCNRTRPISDFYERDKNNVYDYIMEPYVKLLKDKGGNNL